MLDDTARARDLRPWLRLSVDVLDAPFEDAVAAACGPGDLLVLGHHRLHMLPAALIMFRCEDITPLGSPVEPEV